MNYPLPRGGRLSAILLCLLSLAVAVAGYRYHSTQKADLKRVVRDSLNGIAFAKVQAVKQWRGQRIADGLMAMQQSSGYAASWENLRSGRAGFSSAARAWLESFVPGGYERVFVLSPSGDVVYPARSPAASASKEAREAFAAALRTGRPVLSEVHQAPGGGDLHADLVVPLFSRSNTVAGAVLLHSGLEDDLALVVMPSPIFTPSLATALIHNNPDATLYLGFPASGAPELTSIPAAASRADATLQGKEGEYDCVDYRGREVLAATVAIPGTRWSLLAKVDADEVRRQMAVGDRSTLLIIVLLCTVTTLGAAFLWRSGAISLYRELYAAEVRARALSGHYGYLSRYSNDLIFLSDQNGIIIEANERCESALGMGRIRLVGQQFRMLVSEAGRRSFEEGWANAARQDGIIFESELLRDGRAPLPVEISARALTVDGRDFVQAIARDITERKRGEEDWWSIQRTTTDAFCAVDAEGRLAEVNDKYVELVGIPRDQLIGRSVLDPHPDFGLPDFQEHLANLRKSGAERWETWFRRPDGRTCDLDVSAQYLRASGRGFAFIRDITAARQAVRDLEQSQRMVSRIVRIVPDLLYIFHIPERRYSFVKRAFEEFFGWHSSAGAEGGSTLPARLIHPEDLEKVANNHKALADAPESASSDLEFRVRRADGEWRTLRAREVVFSRAGDGAVLEVLGIAEDITEQVGAAEQIRHANALLSATFNASPLALVVNDLEGRVLRWNVAAEKMFGWREEEVLRFPVPFVDEPDLRAHLAEIAAGRNFHGTDLTRRRKDGSSVEVSIWTAPIRSSSGDVAAILAVVMDTTEQKRARAELEKSQASLIRAHRMASLGSWTADLMHEQAEWSDETYRMFGYERGAVTPGWDAYLATVHPDDRAAVQIMRNPPADAAQPYRWDHRIVRPDGSVRHVRQSAVVVRDGSGAPVQLTGTIQDVTEYKVLEEQLWQAQKLETVGRLAGGIAHDFNNLLTVINGYGELLLQHSSSDPFLNKGLSEILAAGERAADLTKNLLTFSRRQIVEIKPVDLNGTIAGMQSILSRLIGDDITLEIDLCSSPVGVMGDPVQIQQVLLNLAVNARDAMPKGGNLRIATLLVDPRNELDRTARGHPDHVMLSVSDTGTGMTEDVRSHLFEPFFTTKEPGKGTGLGLSTVYGIVKQGGGTISVETAAGCGTTFRIYFPVTELPCTELPVPQPQVGQTSRATILIAEDQDDVRGLLVAMLTELGHHPIATRDGESALREFTSAREPIHALISDVLMPGMSGFDLAQVLRASRPDLPVLFISGYAPEASSDAVSWPEWGNCFLAKPFTRDTLARKLSEVLRQAARTSFAG